MKKLLFLFIIFLASLDITAQGEASNWYFGNGAGLIFDVIEFLICSSVK